MNLEPSKGNGGTIKPCFKRATYKEKQFSLAFLLANFSPTVPAFKIIRWEGHTVTGHFYPEKRRSLWFWPTAKCPLKRSTRFQLHPAFCLSIGTSRPRNRVQLLLEVVEISHHSTSTLASKKHPRPVKGSMLSVVCMALLRNFWSMFSVVCICLYNTCQKFLMVFMSDWTAVTRFASGVYALWFSRGVQDMFGGLLSHACHAHLGSANQPTRLIFFRCHDGQASSYIGYSYAFFKHDLQENQNFPTSAILNSSRATVKAIGSKRPGT